MRQPGGPPPFRPLEFSSEGPAQHQGPAAMRPLQVSNCATTSLSVYLLDDSVSDLLMSAPCQD